MALPNRPKHPSELGLIESDPEWSQALAEWKASQSIVQEQVVPPKPVQSFTPKPKSVLEDQEQWVKQHMGKNKSFEPVQSSVSTSSTSSTSSTTPNKVEMPSVIGEQPPAKVEAPPAAGKVKIAGRDVDASLVQHLDSALEKYPEVPKELALGIMMQESRGKVGVTSSAGAKGPMQVMPETFRALGVGDNIDDPKQNIEAGVKHLAESIKRRTKDGKTNWDHVIAGYNTGDMNVDKAIKAGIESGIPEGAAWDETRKYVPGVKEFMAQIAGRPLEQSREVPKQDDANLPDWYKTLRDKGQIPPGPISDYDMAKFKAGGEEPNILPDRRNVVGPPTFKVRPVSAIPESVMDVAKKVAGVFVPPSSDIKLEGMVSGLPTLPGSLRMPGVRNETFVEPLSDERIAQLEKERGENIGNTGAVGKEEREQQEASVVQVPVDPLASLEQKIQSRLDEFANSSLEFKTPKTDAAIKALRESISREMQAITSTGELGKQEAILRQKALDDQNNQQREIQMLVDQEAKAREAKYNEYMEAKNIKMATFRNSKIDPERYFKNQTTGQTVARIIGTILGGIGAGMLKSTSNPVLAIVDGFIERDIQAQQAALNVQREDINQLDSAYAEGLKAFRDVSSAKMLAKRVGLDMIERALESKVVGLKGENAIQQANVAREQLQRQMEMIDLDLGKRLDTMAFEQARKEREAQMLQLKEVQSSLFLAQQNPESAQLEAHLAKLPPLVVDKKTREAARAELGDIQLANAAAQEVVREFSELKDKGWRWNLLDRATQTKLKVAYPKIFSRVKNMVGSASSFSDGDRKTLVDVYQPGAFDFDDTIGEKMKGLVEFLLLDRQPTIKRIGFTPRGRIRSYDLVTPISKK